MSVPLRIPPADPFRRTKRKLNTSLPVEICDRRYSRELERANRELEQAKGELEEFAFVASHDLREPLRMINIFTQLLIERCGSTDAKARKFSEQIEYSVSRMEELINDVVQYSRVVHHETECSGVRIREALDRAVAAFHREIEAAGAEIQIGELPTVLANDEQLSLVFENLISNSLKYASPVRRLRIQVWSERKNGYCAVHFADNGIGFEPKFAERVFGLFKRLHGREVPGTGLGLAICRRIVECYGGKIRASSNVNEGTTFTITLKPWSRHESIVAGGRRRPAVGAKYE